jgi:hypothetical protein
MTIEVSDDVTVVANLFRSSIVPDNSCRDTLLMSAPAVDIYFFFLAFIIGLPVFLAIFFASALPLVV